MAGKEKKDGTDPWKVTVEPRDHTRDLRGQADAKEIYRGQKQELRGQINERQARA